MSDWLIGDGVIVRDGYVWKSYAQHLLDHPDSDLSSAEWTSQEGMRLARALDAAERAS